MFFKRPTADTTKGMPGVTIGEGIHLGDKMKSGPVIIPDEHRKRHVFCAGSTGVGKTRIAELFVRDDIKTGKSTIILDPKCDQRLFSVVFDAARKAGRLDEVMLITPVFPQFSASIDPLAYYYDINELVECAVAGIQGKDPFYGAASRLFVTPVVYGLLIMAKYENRPQLVTINQIYTGVRRDNMMQLKTELEALPNQFAVANKASLYINMLIDNILKPDDYYNSILTTLQANMVPLIAGNIGDIIGRADSNTLIKRLEEGKRVIAVVHTGTMTSPSSAALLGRVLFTMIQKCIGRHYLSKREKLEPALTLHIDEAPTIITPDSLQFFSMAGSANVMAHLYAQSANQLYAALNDEHLGRSLLDNTNSKIFMKTADPVTSDYVVQHFGTKDVLTGVFGESSITTRQVEKDVLKATDLLYLQPRQAFLMTYSGRYAFTAAYVPDPDVKIIFPAAPPSQMQEAA